MRKYHIRKKTLTTEIADSHEAATSTMNARESLTAMYRSKEEPSVETMRDVPTPTHFVWASGDTINPPNQERVDGMAKSGELVTKAITSTVV